MACTRWAAPGGLHWQHWPSLAHHRLHRRAWDRARAWSCRPNHSPGRGSAPTAPPAQPTDLSGVLLLIKLLSESIKAVQCGETEENTECIKMDLLMAGTGPFCSSQPMGDLSCSGSVPTGHTPGVSLQARLGLAWTSGEHNSPMQISAMTSKP